MSARRTLHAASVALALASAGCTVGPDFKTPEPPAVDRYVPGAQPGAIGAINLVSQRDIPAEWWSIFGSAAIDDLVRRALAASPTIELARARLVQAQELRLARSGATEYPKVDATASAVRQRIDPATFGFPEAPNPGPFNVFTIGANVSYTFDLFGGTRRELEALGAEVDYQAYELEAARLTLATNVVITAIRQAALDAQIATTADILAAQRSQLGIIEKRYDLGGVALLDVQNQRALVAQTEASLAPLTAQFAQASHLLAVYVGEPPAAFATPALRLADLRLPPELPLTLPSELARQRPDIRANEALLHKASANVGVATADLYPKIVVSGALSTSQLSVSDLFGNGFNVWNFGVNLLQPLFRGGELQARKRAAVAAFDQAAAAYRLSVLQGLQNVADVLRALEADEAALAARSEQASRASDAYRITVGRYHTGGESQLAVLDAERVRLQADAERLQAIANRFTDAAALFQALGGGWTRQDPTAALVR